MTEHEALQGIIRTTLANIAERERQRAAETGVSLEQLRAREEAEAAEKRKAEAEAERRLNLRRALGPLNLVPLDIESIITDTFDETKPVQHVVSWLAERSGPPVLVLLGGVGCGKTFAAGVAMSRMPAEFVRSSELAARHEPWKADLAAGVRRVQLHAPLLVLDDLGAERSEDPRFAEALFTLIDARMGRVRTLITSNLGKADIRKHYGDRIADRLNHIARVREVAGRSLRRQEAGL